MFGIVVLVVYALLMIFVTLIFTRRATSAESFHVADRRIGAPAAAMSIAATWIWAPSLFPSSAVAYTSGVPGFFWFLVPNVLCLLFFIPFAKRIRRQYPEGITLTGFRYPLENRDISIGPCLCISNELAAPEAEISFREGVLICVESRDGDDQVQTGLA